MRANQVTSKPAYAPTLNISLTPCPETKFSTPKIRSWRQYAPRRNSIPDHRPLAEQQASRAFPFLPPVLDPLSQQRALDMVNAAIGHNFELRRHRQDRKSA
jgi:hypothetical protein